MMLVRLPMTNLKTTVRADCTVFLHVPPSTSAIKDLAFVQMAAFLCQLPTSKIKQTFLSTSLACLLAFSNHSFGNSISLSLHLHRPLYPASLTRDLQQPPPPPLPPHDSQSAHIPASSDPSLAPWCLVVPECGWEGSEWLALLPGFSHPPSGCNGPPLSFPGLWQAELSAPSDGKPHYFLYVAFLFILQLSVHRLLPQGHYSWSQVR